MSGPPPAWPAQRNIDKRSEAGQAGGGPLDGRVRPHFLPTCADAALGPSDLIAVDCAGALAEGGAATAATGGGDAKRPRLENEPLAKHPRLASTSANVKYRKVMCRGPRYAVGTRSL